MESGGIAVGHGGGLILFKIPGSKSPFKNPNLYSQSISRRSHITIIRTGAIFNARYSRWDSNAESVGSQKFKFKLRDKENDDKMKEENKEAEDYTKKGKKRKWWSDESEDAEEEEAAGILEEAIDSFWIFEVLKSYGWALPPIIVSWLLATGPKAFFMTLAIPIGQSALTFVYKLLWGKTKSKTKRKPRKKRRKGRKPFTRSRSNVEMDEKEEEEEMGNGGFRSWVNDDGSVKEKRQDASYFGGWDELDGNGMEFKKRPSQTQRTGHSPSPRTPSRNGKLGKTEKTSDVPLLLRLLIAVFPFLGSWTKML